ncbi:enoyl-CoA hydratase/isomerase family protein [candidate division KSB1 bacterium]|nr:enoyl-CoA hydratase/isomerase family protein [candidate division KSB1 bacterium]
MTYQYLHLEKQNAAGILRFNRPETLNAFEAVMVQEIPVALRELLTDDEVRVIILTGNGKGFCAGADVKYLNTLVTEKDLERGKVLVTTGSEVVEMIHSADKPVIAALNGAAVGGGAGLALACAIRLMAQSASLSFAFIRIGLHPDLGCTYFLPRLVGPAQAAELFMTGRMISAHEALALGLTNHVVADEELMPQALTLAAELAEKSPLALRLIKKGLQQTFEQALDAMLKFEVYGQASCFASIDAQEALRRFEAAQKAKRRANN